MFGATVALPGNNPPPFDCVNLVTGAPVVSSVMCDYGMHDMTALYGVLETGVDMRWRLERPSNVVAHVEQGSMALS